MHHQVLELIFSSITESCSLDLLTNEELVELLFSFCSKENTVECKKLLDGAKKDYKQNCKPNRQHVKVYLKGQVLHKQLKGITNTNVVYIKISYESLGGHLQRAFTIKRNKQITNANMTHEKFNGPTLNWEEDDGSSKHSAKIKRIVEMRDDDNILFSENMMEVVSKHRGNPVYADGQEVVYDKTDNKNYIYIPILLNDTTMFTDKSFIKVQLSLLMDDSFLKIIELDEKFKRLSSKSTI